MESLLTLVAQKIVFALASEVTISLPREEKIQRDEANDAMILIKSEFEHMDAFIRNVNPEEYATTVHPWLQRAREVANKMEDIIDEYLHLSTVQSQSSRLPIITICGYSFPWGASAWKDINKQLKKIASDLSHLNDMKVRYEISKFKKEKDEGDSSKNEISQTTLPHQGSFHATEDNIINKKQKETLTQWLTDGQHKLLVVSVHGMGGVGKTFMVREVYNSNLVDSHFHCKCWVTIPKTYQMEQVLTLMYKDLLGGKEEHADETSQKNANDLVDKVSKFVEVKRYLIILDNVSNTQAYYDVKGALPDNGQGSRIVITTRSPEIALIGEEKYRIPLNKLNDSEAMNLFCREAFPQDQDRSTFPEELKEIGKSIVGKCEGLPLAIVSIARLLSLKRKNRTEWTRFYDKLDWEFSNNQSLKDVKSVVMNTSYEDLPSYLKNCFLFCSMFPDSEIRRNKLIRLWIAESFIQGKGTQTMEEVAEEFLDELIHRSMLNVVDWNSFGRVKMCRMHNLVRDLTLERARKENFSFVWKDSESSHTGNGARRLFIHDYSSGSNLFHMDFSGTRSLFVIKSASPPIMGLLEVISSRAQYLRIVDLEHANIDKLPDVFTNLFNLHYLGLRDTKVKLLPDSIRRLQNLQTLDLRDTQTEKLPRGISQLTNMRHLLTLSEKRENLYSLHLELIWFAKAPKGICNLASLQQLDMAVDEASIGQLEKLTQLKVLRLSNIREVHYHKLTTSISQMPTLRNLWLIAENKNEVMQLRGLDNILPNLQKLRLYGTLLLAPAAIDERRRRGLLGDNAAKHVTYSELKSEVFAKLQNIRLLSLSWSRLQADPLPELGRFHQLTVLNLREAYDGELLCFRKGWFPQLNRLRLLHLRNLRKIIFERGSVASLQNLRMVGLLKLATIPQGMEHLASVRHLILAECNSIFIHEIKENPRGCVAQQANIVHMHNDDGDWVSDNISLSQRDDQEQEAPNSQNTVAPIPRLITRGNVAENFFPSDATRSIGVFGVSSTVRSIGGPSGHSPYVASMQQEDSLSKQLPSSLFSKEAFRFPSSARSLCTLSDDSSHVESQQEDLISKKLQEDALIEEKEKEKFTGAKAVRWKVAEKVSPSHVLPPSPFSAYRFPSSVRSVGGPSGDSPFVESIKEEEDALVKEKGKGKFTGAEEVFSIQALPSSPVNVQPDGDHSSDYSYEESVQQEDLLSKKIQEEDVLNEENEKEKFTGVETQGNVAEVSPVELIQQEDLISKGIQEKYLARLEELKEEREDFISMKLQDEKRISRLEYKLEVEKKKVKSAMELISSLSKEGYRARHPEFIPMPDNQASDIQNEGMWMPFPKRRHSYR